MPQQSPHTNTPIAKYSEIDPHKQTKQNGCYKRQKETQTQNIINASLIAHHLQHAISSDLPGLLIIPDLST